MSKKAPVLAECSITQWRDKQHLPDHVVGCIISDCLGIRVVPASNLCVCSVPGCGPRGEYSGQEAFVG